MVDATFTIECSPNGRDGLANITVKRGNEVLAVDVLKILDSKIREEFARTFCAEHSGIAEADFSAELLKAADKIAKAKAKGDKPNKAEVLVELTMGVELFHTPEEDEAYGTMTVKAGHRETWAINSTGFRQWLIRAYYKACGGKIANAETVQNALNVISALAVFEGEELPVFLRLAEHEGLIYVDLANKTWQAVRIDSEGWEVVESESVPVRFIRKRGMLAIPTPVHGGTVEELYDFVNLPDTNDRILFVGWLLAALRPKGPYPVLAVNGEQGSTKSTLCRFARTLIDPNALSLRRPPKDERDLAVYGSNAHVLAFDNLSGLRPVFSDGLCALATGSGLGTRKLYSNGEEFLFFGTRPIVINGIEDVAVRPDLMDRSVQLTLPQIPPAQRKEESELVPAFEEARPRILGALFDAVSCALRRYGQTQIQEKPRMADFARWVTAAEPALGWEAGAFMEAYLENRSSANASAIEASQIGPVVVELMRKVGKWQGTSGELLAALDGIADARTRLGKDWPKSARGLSGQLQRIAPNLRAAGIRQDRSEKRSERGWVFSLESSTGKTPSGQSLSPDSGHKSLEDNSLQPDGTHDGRPFFPDGPDGSPDGPDGPMTVSDAKPSVQNPLKSKDLEGVDIENDDTDGKIPLILEGTLKDFDWILKLSPEDLPGTPFVLNSTMKIMDGGKYLNSLQADLRRGPQGPRASCGALQEQCRDLGLLLNSSE